MKESIGSQKDQFILERGITYLNCANMSPLLKSVREAGLEALNTRAAPWKLSSDDWFMQAEKLRSLAGEVFQTGQNNIALIPSASYGLAVAAKNLQISRGKNIIILKDQFPSNYYVWKNLADQCGLEITEVAKSTDKTLTENILDRINKNTGLVTLPNCHWMDGTLVDLPAIKEAARSVGAFFVLDLSQSMGALPIDIEQLQPDFAVSVGYKWLLGPYSLGYMYVSEKWQKEGEPLEYSWMTRKGSEDFTGLTGYANEYRDGARKFDMGEFSQFNTIQMAIAALQQILRWKISSIQSDLKKLTDRIIDYKKKSDIFDSRNLTAGHMTSIPFKNENVNTLTERLKQNNIVVSFRGSFIRISPHLYNDMNDIEKLITCLEE